MSEIALPAGFCPNAFMMQLYTNQRMSASPYGGSEQVGDFGNDRWSVSLSLPARLFADAARVEAFIASLRGMTNTVRLFHWVRKAPRGTMRGTPTAQAAAAGAQVLQLNATAGATLNAGDLIGVSGLLLMVAEDTVANGAGYMVVYIANRLRLPVANGAPVTWDKPTTLFRQTSQSAGMQYVPGYANTVSFDFAEAIG